MRTSNGVVTHHTWTSRKNYELAEEINIYSNLPPPVDFVFRFRYRLRCLFETSQKNSAMGRHFFLQDKNDRKLHEDTCIFICTNLNSIMGLFRANNIVANFWMLFATLSAYGVVASEVGPGVDRFLSVELSY